MKLLIAVFSFVLFLTACNEGSGPSADQSANAAVKQETPEERNKNIIAEVMVALNAHDSVKLLNMMADDVIDYGDGTEPPVKSRDSIKAGISAFFSAFPDYKADNLKYFADGNHVVVLGDYSGTFKNDLGKMKATGKSFKFSDADIFTLNDNGKITSHRYIQPNATMFAQVSGKGK